LTRAANPSATTAHLDTVSFEYGPSGCTRLITRGDMQQTVSRAGVCRAAAFRPWTGAIHYGIKGAAISAGPADDPCVSILLKG
jgi:hypothetical protein